MEGGSLTLLKTFNNYTIIMANNSDKIRIFCECGGFVSVAYFTVNSAGYSDEFHVAFKHSENLENLILNILKEKLHILTCGFFFLKTVSSF